MRKVVIDTNVFIDWRRAKKGVLGNLVDLGDRGSVELLIPSVVIMEYWSGKEMDEIDKVKKAELMFSRIEVVDLSEAIAKKAGELIRSRSVQGAVDAMVVATALELGAEVATRNRKHFEKVAGLTFFK